ncbi:MAG: ATP-binding cassette domain-containing protein [Pseudomonadota bacterium]
MALVTLSKVRTPAHRDQAFECDQWRLEEGQKWAVLGNNGAGKTLLARVLLGRHAISRGRRLYAEGFNPSQESEMVSFERQRELHEHDDRFDDSEVRADAYDRGTLVHQHLHRGEPAAEEYRYWTQRLGVSSITDLGLRELSTGQMRRVLIAGAALCQTRLLILDDPLAGLDQAFQSEFEAVLHELFDRLHTALLLTSRISDVPDSVSHLMLISEGRVVLSCENTAQNRQQIAGALAHDVHRVNLQTALVVRHQQLATAKEILIDPLIQIANASCSFGEKRVFADLCWSFRPGQHALIAGPNGCGKSSLLSMLTGDNAKAFGQQISLFGRLKGSGESVWEIRQHFGVVSTALQQQFGKGYLVIDVVVSGLQDSIGISESAAGSQTSSAQAWLEAVGVAHLAAKRFEHLSYGQQRLVLIARAMVKQPDILILDEPCLGLDERNRQHVLALLQAIVDDTSTQILFVSHQSDERPNFINQILQFVWSDVDECYRVQVENM